MINCKRRLDAITLDAVLYASEIIWSIVIYEFKYFVYKKV